MKNFRELPTEYLTSTEDQKINNLLSGEIIDKLRAGAAEGDHKRGISFTVTKMKLLSVEEPHETEVPPGEFIFKVVIEANNHQMVLRIDALAAQATAEIGFECGGATKIADDTFILAHSHRASCCGRFV